MNKLPKIGSKDWKWEVEKFENFDYEESHTLETDLGMYKVKVTGGSVEVVFEDPDMNEVEVATFDLFRFGVHTEGRGMRLTKEQAKVGLQTVKRFCEMDARRMAREAAKEKKPDATP